MDTVSQTVELPAQRQNRRHPLEWKRSVVEQTFEPGASVAIQTMNNKAPALHMTNTHFDDPTGLSPDTLPRVT
ncbi:hypothetical protein PTKU46_94980 [Paraburkholderia terrae]